MSVKGELNRINKALTSSSEQSDTSGRSSLAHKFRSSNSKIIIEVVNKTGQAIEPFMCVAIIDGSSPEKILEAVFPSEDDDFELTQYGSVLEAALQDEVVHVQVGGTALFAVSPGSVAINSGEILYPLMGEETTGLLGNKASGTNDVINIPIGRALQGEDTDTELILVNLWSSGSENSLCQFKVLSDEGDYLLCRLWDGTDMGEKVFKVAKPYLIRRTPFDGDVRDDITYTYDDNSHRTGEDNDGNTEDEEITPSYVEGDIIYASKPFNGTDVFDDEDEEVLWLDENNDGRQWAQI